MECTLVLIKPDAFERRLVGKIISRFENRNLKIKALKLIHPPRELAERHYAAHKGKPFYELAVGFLTSGPVVAMVLEGENAIELVRTMIGDTNPLKAQPGTIRGDYTLSITYNLVHGSDSPENAKAEIAIWFKPEEILP
ncbi:MAG: nucleoside-diphosphate kinase [Armatimonadota bacterium]|nr:nucleoside-diphosphate kinase [Armatimonadota bacterium]